MGVVQLRTSHRKYIQVLRELSSISWAHLLVQLEFLRKSQCLLWILTVPWNGIRKDKMAGNRFSFKFFHHPLPNMTVYLTSSRERLPQGFNSFCIWPSMICVVIIPWETQFGNQSSVFPFLNSHRYLHCALYIPILSSENLCRAEAHVLLLSCPFYE